MKAVIVIEEAVLGVSDPQTCEAEYDSLAPSKGRGSGGTLSGAEKYYRKSGIIITNRNHHRRRSHHHKHHYNTTSFYPDTSSTNNTVPTATAMVPTTRLTTSADNTDTPYPKHPIK